MLCLLLSFRLSIRFLGNRLNFQIIMGLVWVQLHLRNAVFRIKTDVLACDLDVFCMANGGCLGREGQSGIQRGHQIISLQVPAA